MHWEKIASVAGLLLALLAVYGRIVTLEARMDATEGLLREVRTSMHESSEVSKRLEIQLGLLQNAAHP